MTEHCPLELADGLVNPDQYKGSIDFWKNEVGRDVILNKRVQLVQWLEKKMEDGQKVVWEEGLGSGQGIVMTGGNKVSFRPPFFWVKFMDRTLLPGLSSNCDTSSDLASPYLSRSFIIQANSPIPTSDPK